MISIPGKTFQEISSEPRKINENYQSYTERCKNIFQNTSWGMPTLEKKNEALHQKAISRLELFATLNIRRNAQIPTKKFQHVGLRHSPISLYNSRAKKPLELNRYAWKMMHRIASRIFFYVLLNVCYTKLSLRASLLHLTGLQISLN